MPHVQLGSFVYDCNVCHTRCDGISKGNYQFSHDADFSEQYEQRVIDIINKQNNYHASKCATPGFPDIELKTTTGDTCKYLEVKVQQRTFMSVEKILPAASLFPSETVALNLSDLLRYFEIELTTNVPVSILWVLINRPCILKADVAHMYYQSAAGLKKIYHEVMNKRRFRRRSGEGDLVEGTHKGVTVNYHFSLKELVRWA